MKGRPALIGVLDPPSDRYLRACVRVLQCALGTELVGAYLYSSAVQGDYIAGRSDLDVVVVVRQPLTGDEALRLVDLVCAIAPPFPTKGLDLTVVTVESARSEQPAPRVEVKVLTFSGAATTADDEPGGDTRVVMHFACCLDHGVALVGPPARVVFAPVSRSDYLGALARELNRAWMPAQYTVLNACRDLRFVDEGVICSKIVGALWALGQGYDPWLIEAALAWQVDGVGPIIDGTFVDEFAARVAARLAAALLGRPISPSGGGLPPSTWWPDARHTRAALGERPELDLAHPAHRSPLVSCVLVSDGDAAATRRAAVLFSAQDYLSRELIVVAPKSAMVELVAALDPAVRVLAASSPDIGVARDDGCAAARGELIALWDQNAWYAPWRLSYQVGALLCTSHDTSAATAAIAWDPVAGACWAERSAPDVGSRQLVAATLCLTRSAWVRCPFVARGRGELDNPAMIDPTGEPTHIPRDAHFSVLVQPGSYVEGVQATRYPPDIPELLLGSAVYLFGGKCEILPEPAEPAEEPLVPGPAPWTFSPLPLTLPAFGPEPSPGPSHDSSARGLDALGTTSGAHVAGQRVGRTTSSRADVQVTCIMPTFNRRRFIAQARRNVLRQDYPRLELVVIDDGTEPVADLLDGLPNCRYVHLDQRVTIGKKRNLACELARGDIIVQWDDDDWYGPHRVSRQVEQIVSDNAEVTGIGVNLLLDLRTMQVWSTREREAADPLFASIEAVAGGTLAYTKDVWRQVGGYPDASIGEDVALMQLMADGGARIVAMSNQGAYVYVRHGRNSWRFDFDPKVGPPGWNPSSPPPAMPQSELTFYATLNPDSAGSE